MTDQLDSTALVLSIRGSTSPNSNSPPHFIELSKQDHV